MELRTFAVGILSLLLSREVEAAESESSSAQGLRLDVDGGCRVAADDEAWIASALNAWQGVRKQLIPAGAIPKIVAIFFDTACEYRGQLNFDTAWQTRFRASDHEGSLVLPSDAKIASEVASFAAPAMDGSVYFVMSLPSIWRSAGHRTAFDLHTFLTAVLLHEMSHVVQFETYLKQSMRVAQTAQLAAHVTDDIVQDRFAEDLEFATSIDDETQLLYAAAIAASTGECKALARKARAMMQARQLKYYAGSLRPLAELEDIFLTLEGSAQFAALAWLASSDGGGIKTDVARLEFGERVKFWSQRQGLALFLVLDRLVEDWQRIVYGAGGETILQLLDQALSSDAGASEAPR